MAPEEMELEASLKAMETAELDPSVSEPSESVSLRGGEDDDSLVGSEFFVDSEVGSQTSPAALTQSNRLVDNEEQIAPNETRMVICVRLFVISVLVATTVAASLSLYFTADSYENKQFQAAAEAYSTTVANSWASRFEEQLANMESLGSSTTSYANVIGATWPFVTVPNFYRISSSLSGLAQLVMLLPTISTNAIRLKWETYSIEHQQWINESLAYQLQMNEADNTNSRRLQSTITEYIFRINYINNSTVRDDHPPPFLPVWQNSPVNNQIVNYNLLSDPVLKASVTAALESKQVVLSDTTQSTIFVNGSAPQFSLLYPVFDGFGSGRSLVGLLSTVSFWSSYLDNTMIPSPMVAVVKNSCNQVFSFQIQGSDALFLGVGDHHDSAYDSFEQSFNLSSMLNYHGETLLQNGALGVCQYSLHIYPTSDMASAYQSRRPEFYAVAAAAMFALFCLAFYLYHFFVERRQAVVVRAAKRSKAIVESLFPSVVHDRLFQDGETPGIPELAMQRLEQPPNAPQRQASKASDISTIDLEAFNPLEDAQSKGSAFDRDDAKSTKSMKSEPATQRLRTFLTSAVSGTEDTNNYNELEGITGKPIADLFPDATVLFADICGFTAWSSVREPAQVFTLLETLYAAFDKLVSFVFLDWAPSGLIETLAALSFVFVCDPTTQAKKRNVFKVETIGDCYVAVTGLPDPMKDHALGECWKGEKNASRIPGKNNVAHSCKFFS